MNASFEAVTVSDMASRYFEVQILFISKIHPQWIAALLRRYSDGTTLSFTVADATRSYR
jgi:hypothetical protein